MSIRTDSNRLPSVIANIASDVITLNNYQVSSNLYAVAPGATHTFQSMSQSNVNISSLLQNERFESVGFKSVDATVSKANVSGTGNALVINQLVGKDLSLQQSLDLQNGLLGNVNQAQLRNLNVSTYLYGNSYTLPSITLGDGSGTFAKNVDVYGALQSNVLTNSVLSITQLENSENVTTKDGNVTNNMTLSNMYVGDGAKIENNSVTFTNAVDMNGDTTTITSLRADEMNVVEKSVSGTISQMSGTTTVSYITPTEMTFAGTGEVNEETYSENKIVRRFADVINGVFESNLDVTTLYATVDGISQLSSNLVNVTDTLYVSTQYNHTTNDINTNGNLITTTNSVIAPTVNILNGAANITRRVFNSDTISANVVYPDALFINQSGKAGNLNTGALQAGSYNALRRITTTGNVESNVVIANGLRGTGEFIFNAEVEVNTLQTVDLNLNNTTISFLSSNSDGANIDIANLNSYTTSNVITGYTTANIISANVVQDIVVGNVLANVKVGEVVTGNIYLGNILTEIIVSNTSANLIVGNISTFLTVGNTVANVVVGNISSNIFVGNLEVIGIVGNVSSNVITGNITSNVIVGYQESNIIVGNVESEVLVGQTTSEVITGYTIENVITGNTTANVIVGTYEEEVLIGNTIANVVVGNVTANVISGYELANVVIGNVYANIVVGNVLANIVVGNVLGNIVIGNIEQTIVVGNIEGNGIVGNVYANIVVGNIEQSNVIVGNTVVPNVVIGNVLTENVVIGNIETVGIIGNTIVTGVSGNTVTSNILSGNLVLSSVAIDSISIPSILGNLASGNLNGNIVVNKSIGNVVLTYESGSSGTGNIMTSTFTSVPFTSQQLKAVAWSPHLSLFVALAQDGSGNRFLTSPDGTNWTNRTSTADVVWNSVTWSSGLNLFVAVGTDSCATSSDGINWTSRTIPVGNWSSVVWASTLNIFAAVSTTGADSTNLLSIVTSPDGITWTSRTAGKNYRWESITWSPELSKFVTVASGGPAGGAVAVNVMTSSDGITWTNQMNSYSGNQWCSVAWSPTLGMFVAVARSGSTAIMTSSDGETWTSQTSPETQNYTSVIWVPEYSIFVAVANSGTYKAIYSYNGVNWYSFTTSNISGSYQSVAWAPSISTLCAVNNDATNKVMIVTANGSSTSTISGNIIETNYFLGNIFSSNILIGNILTENVLIGNTMANIIVGNTTTTNIIGNIVTTGITGNITSNVMTNVYDPTQKTVTMSGIDWGNASVYPSSQWMESVTYSESLNLFVAVTTKNLFMTSSDGDVWTSFTGPGISTTSWVHIIWCEELGLFVALNRNYTRPIATSPDGTTWTLNSLSTTNTAWQRLVWAPEINKLLAVGNSTGTNILVSSDGLNWSTQSTLVNGVATALGLLCGCWSSTLEEFLVIGAGTTHYKSKDAINWTAYTNPGANWKDVTWSPVLKSYCAVTGTNGNIYRSIISPDGINWTTSIIGVGGNTYNVYRIKWISDYNAFFASMISSNGGVSSLVYSYNGLDWNFTNMTPSSTTASGVYDFTYSSTLKKMVAVRAQSPPQYSDLSVVDLIDSETFIYRTTSLNLNWRSICWSSELVQFVAVASSGTINSIRTSPNGRSWTNRTAPNTNNLTSVCWSSELSLYCAVASSGTGNRVITSPDGVTWTARTSAADHTWSSVCWSPELSLFVAVSNQTNASVMVSSNGTTWLLAAGVPTLNNLTSVCWSSQNSVFVAVSSTGVVLRSLNGSTWTQYSGASSNAWQSVCWAPELLLFVAVSNSGTGDRVMTSPDGITWTSRSSAADYAWSSITWAGDIGRFYVVSEDTNNFIMTSKDGAITWTLISTSYNTFSSICWAPEIGKICAVASLTTSSNRILDSNELFSLVKKFTLNTGNVFINLNNINAYEWSGNVMVGVGSGTSNIIAKSTHGLSWNDQTSTVKSLYDKNWTSTCWSEELGIYCAVSNSGTGYRAAISTDGINWTPVLTPADNNWTSVIWAAELGLFVAVASSGTGDRVMTSPDGTTWTLRTSAADNSWNSVVWASSLNLLCAVSSTGSNNRVMTSPDGITWTTRTSTANINWTSVAWSPSLSLFCAVANSGTNNRIMTSPDGITWTIRNTNYNDFAWSSVIWVTEISKFYITSTGSTFDNVIATSSDGINWLLTYPPTDANYSWNSLAWSSTLGELYGVGKNSNGNISTLMSTNSMLSGNVYTPDTTDGNILSFAYSSLTTSSMWRNAAWSPKLKLFAAVSWSGTQVSTSGTGTSTVATSPDGLNWTLRTAPNTNNLQDIVWSPKLSLFVAVASSGSTANYITTSSTGITWSARTTPTGSNVIWNAIEWSDSLGIFCAVSETGLIMTSSVGTSSWVLQSTYNGMYVWRDIVWSPQLGIFVITTNTSTIAVSSNGTSWTLYTTPSNISWSTITWSPELGIFVAVSLTTNSTIDKDQVMTSPDGINWTIRQSAARHNWAHVTWIGGDIQCFFATQFSIGNNVMYSYDGINWVLLDTTQKPLYAYSCITYAPEIGQICGVPSNLVTPAKFLTYSTPFLPNYRNFTITNTTNKLGNINSLSWSPSLNTFTGLGNGTVNLIQDQYANISGNSLVTTSNYSFLSNNWKSLVYSPTLNIYVAVSSSGTGNRIMTSSDGTFWVACVSPADNNWEKVIWVSELGLFIAVASSGDSNRIMTSPNGTTWTLRTTSNNNWKSIAWAPTIPLLCAVGSLTYTKPDTLYNTTNNKIASIANDMTNVADGSVITSFGSYTTVAGIAPKYYSSGGYKNKPCIQFTSINETTSTDILNISSLALNIATNGGFTLVTKVYIAEGKESHTRYPIWQTNNTTSNAANLMGLYYYSPSQVGSSNGYFEFGIWNTSTQICNISTSSTFALNSWYTITFTIAAANGSVGELYVDGVLAGSGAITAALTNRTNIYNYLGQDTTNRLSRFLGFYDSIFVYDRKLNSTELQTIYDYIEGTSGDNNSIITSSNGITWTPRSTGVDTNNLMSIAWSPKLSLFVAIGNNYLGNRIIRSSDGITWTPCKVNYDYLNWKTIIWVEDLGLFYATTTDNSYDNALLTSSNGIDWYLTYPPSDAQYSWKNFVWAKSTSKLYCFGEDINGNAAILSHATAIPYTTSNVSTTTPVYGNITTPQYGNVTVPIYGNVEVPEYGNIVTPVYGNIITSLYGNIIIPKYSDSNTEVFANIYIPTTENTSNISISGNVISSDFNLTIPLYADKLTPTFGNINSPIYGNITIPEYGNIITPVYGNILIPIYDTVIEPIYANVLVPVYGNVLTPVYGNVITPVYGQAYLPVYGEVLVPQYDNVLVPEYGFIQLPIYEEVTTPVYGNVIVPVYETQEFPIYEEQTVPVYTAVPTPIYSTVVEDIYETVYTPIYQVSNVAIYETVITPIYTEFITPIYGTIYLPQYEEVLTPIIEERVTPIYEEVITPVYQETIIPITTYVYTPVYQDIVEPVYEDVLQPVYGKALLPVYTEIQIPIYSEVLVYMDPTAKTSSSKDIFTGSATVTNLLSFADGTVNNLFSLDSLYAPNLSLMSNHTPLGTGNMVVGNINAGNLVINPNYGARVSLSTDRVLSSFRNTTLSGQLVVGNISVNRNYISFNSNQELKPGNIDIGQTLFATGLSVQSSNTTIQNISTLNGDAMIHISDGITESNIRDNRIYTSYVSSNNSVSLSSLSVSGDATTQNINVTNNTNVSGNIYARNGMMSSNLDAQYVIATDNMFISSNVSGTFTMPRTDAGNLTIKDTVRNNNIQSSSLQDILDLHANIASSTLYQSIDSLRNVLNKDANDNLYLGSNVVGNIYIGGPGAIAQSIYIGSALDTIYIGGDLSNIFTTDTNVKDATIIINHGGSSYDGAGVEFEESALVKGSLLLNSSGQFIFTDATGNVYSLTYIADGNFENMSVNGTILGTNNISSNVITVQQSLNAFAGINTNLFENSGNATAENVNVSGETTTSTLVVPALMESAQLTVSGNTTLTGNVVVSNDTSTSSLTTQSMTSGNMTLSSYITTQDLLFTTYSGTNATISNLSNIQTINTNSIQLHAGNLTTTNTLITKDIELDSSNITTHDSIYEFRVKGTTHFGANGTYDTNNFGVMNITTSNVNPEPSLSIVRENNYVWNMGYDNNSNDFVIYDGNVGVRLTATNSQSWSSVSDARYKKGIETINEKSAMEQVMKGRGVYYNYLTDAEDAKPKVGFIAQELREILPEVVDVPEDEEAMLTVRYQEVTALLIQALKGASQEVKELKAQIQSIKEKRKSQV